MNNIFIGYDPKEDTEFEVCVHSILKRTSRPVNIVPVEMGVLQFKGWYKRPMHYDDGLLIDEISGFPMATSHAISRFFVPMMSQEMFPESEFALFMDSDMVVNCDINEIFDLYADPDKSVMCTQHTHNTGEADKMDGQLQHFYQRKNWSSMMIFNVPRTLKQLTNKDLNERPGRDLHSFFWLKNEEIGSIPLTYNALVGYNTQTDKNEKIYHYTLGTPLMEGYENCMHSEKFFQELEDYEKSK